MPDENVENSLENLQKLETDTKAKLEELEKTKGEVKENEEKKEALSKELNRIMTLINKARDEKRTEEVSFVGKLRQENLQKIKDRFIKEVGLEGKADAIKALEESFSRIDSNSVTEDKIYSDFKKAYVSLDPDKFITFEKKNKELESMAEEMKANMSNSADAGSQPISSESIELTKEDITAANWAGIPLEEYRKLKAKGKV